MAGVRRPEADRAAIRELAAAIVRKVTDGQRPSAADGLPLVTERTLFEAAYELLNEGRHMLRKRAETTPALMQQAEAVCTEAGLAESMAANEAKLAAKAKGLRGGRVNRKQAGEAARKHVH